MQTNTTMHLTDAAYASGIRAHLEVHRVNAIIRLYDPATVKPCRVGRNLARVVRQLTLEDAESDTEPVAEVRELRRAGSEVYMGGSEVYTPCRLCIMAISVWNALNMQHTEVWLCGELICLCMCLP